MSNCLLKAWTHGVVLTFVRSFSLQQVINRLTQDSSLVSALRMGEQVLHSDSSSLSTSLSEAQGASQKRGRKYKSQRVGGRAMKHCLLDGTQETGYGGARTATQQHHKLKLIKPKFHMDEGGALKAPLLRK